MATQRIWKFLHHYTPNAKGVLRKEKSVRLSLSFSKDLKSDLWAVSLTTDRHHIQRKKVL